MGKCTTALQHEGETAVRCYGCGERFGSYAAWQDHARSHEAEARADRLQAEVGGLKAELDTVSALGGLALDRAADNRVARNWARRWKAAAKRWRKMQAAVDHATHIRAEKWKRLAVELLTAARDLRDMSKVRVAAEAIDRAAAEEDKGT